MANGVQLATAYISLNVNTADVKDQIRSAFRDMSRQGSMAGAAVGTNLASSLRGSFASRVSGVSLFNPLQVAGVRWAARAGSTIALTLRNAITSAMKTAGVGLGIGAGLGVGSVLLSGLDRLKVLQGAQVQLRVMKKSAEEIQQITNDVLAVVQGTPISLDDAMNAVPQALGAGVKQGEQLKQYIQDIGDAAASTGGKAGFGQISMIFSQILGKGRLMSEEVLQLEENGIRIRNALKNSLGVDDRQLQKMIEDGKVGMREVQAAVQSTFGGLSRQMGNTFQGATDNLKAAAARLGANILGAIFGNPDDPSDPLSGATASVTKMTEKLDEAGKWVKDNRQEIRNFFTGVGDVAGGVVDAVKKVVDWFKQAGQAAQNLGTKISDAFQWATGAIGRLIDRLKDIKTGFENIVNTVKTTVQNAFNAVFGPDSVIGKVLNALGIGTPTANAAAAGPVNAGPVAPGMAVPGTFGPGSSGTLGAPTAGGGLRVGGAPGMSTTGQFGGTNTGPMAPSATGATPGSKTGSIRGSGVPYGLPMGTDTGGYGNPSAQKVFPAWVHQLGNQFGVKPSTYAGHQEGSGINQGIDWVGTVEQMQAFAEALIKNRPAGLEQVIWQNPNNQQPLGLTPDGQVVTDPNGYYRNDWSGHQDHVHTRFSQGVVLEGFASGGPVFGAGTATSDSIPALLSNGEHVLTAKDVKMMGGQNAVYAFRNALSQGKIPGFAPGGAVDPTLIQDQQNRLADLQNQATVAQQQFDETMASGNASELEIARSRQALQRSKRDYEQAAADAPIIQSGGTPPDRSLQNSIFDTTDRLELAQLELAALQAAGDAPTSQMTAATYAVEAAKRDRAQAIAAAQPGQDQPNFLDEFVRSGGFVPVAAGNTGVAGTSSIAGILNMGSEFAGSLIDTGASMAQTAVSAAITAGAAAGTFGAAAPAAPAGAAAANFGIQVAANIAKRGVSYGFQLAGIGADALIAQLFPFGAPRWIGYDYTQFLPQMGLGQAAIGTLEQMGTNAINRFFNPQQNPTVPPDPNSPASTELPDSGQGQIMLNGPAQQTIQGGAPGVATSGTFDLMPWLNPQPGGGGGSWARGGEVKIYDQGGILKPGDLALNASRKPERILTDKQWDSLANIAPAGQQPLVKIDAIYGMSPQDVAAKIEDKQRLAMMRYTGRP